MPQIDLRLRFTGVGDGIGRVWGLKNVQGQCDLFQRYVYPIAEILGVDVSSRRNGGVFLGCSWNVLKLGGRQRRCLDLR